MTIIKGYFGILENSEDLIAHLEDSLPSQNSQEMPEMLAATRNC